MTETSYAAVTTAHLNHDVPALQGYLQLVEDAKSELCAIEAGFLNQTPAARELQNRAWTAQSEALLEIVADALRAGVPADAVMEITHREYS